MKPSLNSARGSEPTGCWISSLFLLMEHRHCSTRLFGIILQIFVLFCMQPMTLAEALKDRTILEANDPDMQRYTIRIYYTMNHAE